MAWSCTSCGNENPEGTKFCGQCGAPRDQGQADRESAATDALRSFVSEQVASKLVQSGGELREERRLVTSLFADVSGFTPLADRLDPEQLLEVIDPIIGRLTNVVGRYEGYVDKFAGDALLAFFGAPISHEDDAARALLVAQEMHRELAELAGVLPEAEGLTLHVGVNTGHVVARVLGTDVRMDYSVLGDAVILAQRLESAAPAGETYVGRSTYLLTRDRFDFEPVGELTLKGKADPVETWRLVAERRRSRGLAPLVGRDAELQQIGVALDALGKGSGRVISVSGEPGVGKSRFTAEVHQIADDRGYRWLAARCLSYGAGIAYWPYSELIRKLAGIGSRDSAERAAPRLEAILDAMELKRATPFFARMIGLPAPEIEHYDPESYRLELSSLFGVLFRWLAEERPTILTIEDLQWGDASSIGLTTELANLTGDNPIAIYVTARRDAIGSLLEVAAAAPEASRHALNLDPLDAPSTAPMLENLLGAPCTASLVDAVNERAVGNPFFTTELARALVEADGLTKADDGWGLSAGFDLTSIPPTIEGVLASRIDKLSPNAASTLQAASVIGRRVRLPLLRLVTEVSDVEGALSELTEAGLIDDVDPETGAGREDEAVIHHALVQDVAYARLLRKDRRALHLRVAEVAEEMYGANDDTIDLLARHLHLAEAGPKAIDYLIRAGYRAAALFANDEAIVHLGHALELAQKHALDRRGAILLKLADLHELRGDYSTALDRYTQARDLTGNVLAWRGMALSYRNLAEYDSALGVVEEGLRNVTGPDAAHLWLEKGWVHSRQGRFADAIQAFEAGLEAAGNAAESVVGHLRLQLARAQLVTGDRERAKEHVESAVLMFEQLGDRRGWSTALRILGGDLYRATGQLDDAIKVLHQSLELARETGNAEEQGAALINLGMIEMERDNLEVAIAHDHDAIDQFARIGIATGQAIGYGNLTEKLLLAGRHLDALEVSARALDLARSIGDMETVADVTKTVAAVRLAQGNPMEAAQTAEEAASLYLEMDARLYAIEALEIATNAWREAGFEDRARDATERAGSLS